MTTRWFGARVQRMEDDRLLRGRGRYTDDIDDGALESVLVRSPYAHARITSIDVSAAREVPGVRAVPVMDPYTAERAMASNNAQIITFGQLIVGPAVAKMLTDIWLNAEFQSGRSGAKVAKMDAIDEKYRKSIK